MPLTNGEDQLLYFLGEAYLHLVAKLAIFCFGYGLFNILFWKSVVHFRRRRLSSLAARVMFYATVINFLIFTLDVGSQIAEFIVFLRMALVDTVDLPLAQRRKVTNEAMLRINIAQFWGDLATPISDLVVIWRAWAIYRDRPWVLSLPFTLWLATIGTQLTYLIMLLTPAARRILGTGLGGQFYMIVNAALGLSIATNAVTTMLIGYKLWSYRVLIIKNLGLSNRKSPAQKVLVLLVESGILYCGLQVTYLALGLRSEGNEVAGNIFAAIYSSITAMYPTIVLNLVGKQRSMADMYAFSTK